MIRKPMPPRKAGLKPGGPLQRHSSMKTSGSLQRGKGLRLRQSGNGTVRKGSLARSTKPLPAVNTARQARKTEAAGLSKSDAQDIVHARSGGWCELRIPGVCLGRATNVMHRKPEGQGGLYVPSDLLDGCGMGNTTGCHRYQETNRTESYANGRLVRRKQDHRLRPVRMWHKGVEGEYLLDDVGGAVLVREIREAS